MNVDRILIAVALACAFAAAAWKWRALSPSGAVAAAFVGTAAYGFGDFAVAVPLVMFFLTGTLLSHVRNPRALQARALAHKGSTRDAAQVLANGGAAAACAVMAGVPTSVYSGRDLHWTVAALGALAVAAADTWATEIGGFSAVAPRSIATLCPVRPGVSGGVTALGLGASLLGGALVGVVAAPFIRPLDVPHLIAACAAIGFAGATIDSVLGAALQGAWHCDGCGDPCESPIHRCGERARYVRGLPFLNNDAVNALSTVTGAIIAWLAFSPGK